MKTDNYESTLPEGYELAYTIDAKNDKKIMLIYTLISFVPPLITVGIAIALIFTLMGGLDESMFDWRFFISLFVTCAALLLYVVLHELVHGAAYKALTGQKLTFGVSLTVAFCGVPNIYVYRKTALISVLMPFVVFLPIFLGLAVGMYFVSPVYLLEAALILGAHIGGCVGDLHVTHTLAKLKDARTLMRDTGPIQEFYVPTRKPEQVQP